MAEGLDIYTKYQSVEDWGAVRRSGRTFAYFKGTDGMTTRDTANWPQAAKAAGIACGLYGYAQPGSAADQYDLLLRTARSRNALDLSPALDLEDPFVPGNTAAQFAIAWLRRAVDAGQIPVFYANDSMMGYLLATVRNSIPSVWPWIARYGARPKNAFRTWQHSSSGVVPGIKASGVDLNTGDAPVIVGPGPAPRPTPTPTPIPGGRLTVAQMEEAMFNPVIHGPTPIVKDGGGPGKDTQIEFAYQLVPPCGGQLIVQPLDDKTCFFGNAEPAAPVGCWGPGGGMGGGHSVVPAGKWKDGTERRADWNNAQAYEVPKGTTRVTYSLSSNGRTAVMFVPSYLLG
jgi:GH25 family lysozyme M1 (1,4-beta-N-acetylmuramidase)